MLSVSRSFTFTVFLSCEEEAIILVVTNRGVVTFPGGADLFQGNRY